MLASIASHDAWIIYIIGDITALLTAICWLPRRVYDLQRHAATNMCMTMRTKAR